MFQLKTTCSACPEAYNAYLNNEYVGNLYLRNGCFYVYNSDGECVYCGSPKGNGIFEPEERDFYLNEGCKAIQKAIEKKKVKNEEELIFEICDND